MATTARRIRSVNPATEETIEEFDPMGGAQVDRALDSAMAAFAGWRDRGFEERAEVLHGAARVLRADRARLAEVVTGEMGKTLAEAEAEVEKCAVTCDHYADHAASYLADQPAPSDSPRSFVAFQPLGPVLAVMPWNFPLWQVVRFAAPALMAGNVGLLKHASNVSRCALEIEDVLRRAGCPEGVFTTLLVGGAEVEGLIADPRVRAVTLTGSDATGERVAAAAGASLKKSVLELGGSDAFIVLEDADLDRAAAVAVTARFQNCGQSCIAAKRFIVVDAAGDGFEERLVERVRALRVGDPTDRDVAMGPMARSDLRDELERQVRQSVAAGALVATGGRRRQGRGWFVDPTVLLACPPDSTAFTEETFGPLAAVTRVRDEAAAVDLANASAFGLGGNVWTADLDRGERVARRLDTGGVFVNGMTHSDPRLPFGGVKRSGYGRELHAFGIREFVNVKTIWLGDGHGDGRTQRPAE